MVGYPEKIEVSFWLSKKGKLEVCDKVGGRRPTKKMEYTMVGYPEKIEVSFWPSKKGKLEVCDKVGGRRPTKKMEWSNKKWFGRMKTQQRAS